LSTQAAAADTLPGLPRNRLDLPADDAGHRMPAFAEGGRGPVTAKTVTPLRRRTALCCSPGQACG